MEGLARLRLLLDTHIWLWLVGNPGRLNPAILQELRSANNELWLSPMSTWEALTLHRKNRMYLADDLDQWVALATYGTKEAVLTHDVVLAARTIALPVDRLLAATAQILRSDPGHL
jgi:PIN domain nuclease of toxin-antitoxin system